MIFGRSFFRDFFDCFLRAKFNVAQSTLYDYRGKDGTGTASNPASGSNAVSYTVRKLADGNCWMTDNLKLTLSTSHSYEVATFSGGTTTWTPNQDTSSTNPYNVAISQNTKANVNGGNWYYPWYAATAGQGTNTANPTINRSICPKGWRLPSSSEAVAPSFVLLNAAYATLTPTEIKTYPFSYAASAFYYSGNLYNTIDGIYWSSTAIETDNLSAYSLRFNANVVNPKSIYSLKSSGQTIRCAAIP